MTGRPIEVAGGAVASSGTGIAPASSREAAFDKARRHSNLVRILKFALPVAAIAIAVAFLGKSYMAAPSAIEIKSDDTAFSDGKLVMANPKLDGYTKDNQPYSMTARRAVQDASNQGVVELEGIDASLPLDKDNMAKVEAQRGVFDRDKNTLNLSQAITLTTTDGIVALFQSAFLNMAEGEMTTSEPVQIKLDGSTINSDSMNVLQNGKVFVFENKVRVTIEPQRYQTMRQDNGDL
ncbi:LPS export ABC transporter periplasmic protein LptC [Corticibacterium sp. UT-5YL-CI-8]|nr:LPS export ABC transporter periplasmic protein LptC [Tianweitania sp. UT-5YL-CI-8]